MHNRHRNSVDTKVSSEPVKPFSLSTDSSTDTSPKNLKPQRRLSLPAFSLSRSSSAHSEDTLPAVASFSNKVTSSSNASAFRRTSNFLEVPGAGHAPPYQSPERRRSTEMNELWSTLIREGVCDTNPEPPPAMVAFDADTNITSLKPTPKRQTSRTRPSLAQIQETSMEHREGAVSPEIVEGGWFSQNATANQQRLSTFGESVDGRPAGFDLARRRSRSVAMPVDEIEEQEL